MISYVKGDATAPIRTPALIAHICNDQGMWGAGFVSALAKRWPEVKGHYRSFVAHGGAWLGAVQFLAIDSRVSVANMIAQGPHRDDGPLVRYDALDQCLASVAAHARYWRKTVHMPRIGCGIGGGTWVRVEPIIERTLVDADVYVYDLPGLP